ncbi:MAG: hypothetical protein D5R96_03875 [Methanocalculus sp. MSAO_Arc2]|uniref:DMT family transporter n=1 Tax=Methanocalculus sp. MSAO_Arc2 TaxID=2293855 RepID=UPI000FF77340|nr:MAG: hypothetical protein D5R96_03875 [Methanocalculus sp. MSAO_Arc2]
MYTRRTSDLIIAADEEIYFDLPMLWFFFALGGALSQAVYAGMVKSLLQERHPYVLAGFSFLSASFFLFASTMIIGPPPLGPDLFPAVFGTVLINIIATILLYQALTTSDLSLCIPMLAFTPVFLLATSFVILGELPTLLGACGMLLVATGAYLLHLDTGAGRIATLMTPFLRLSRDRGIQSMLVVAFLFSISVNFDKKVVENSDPFFGSMIVFFLLATAFLFLATVRHTGHIRTNQEVRIRPLMAYLAVGVVLACEIIMINLAYTLNIVPYVISIKRLAIIFSVFFGILLFQERFGWGRIIGAAIMVIGAGTIAIYG